MKIRKFLSIALLLTLMFSLATPAFADSYDDEIADLRQQIKELEIQAESLKEDLKSFNLSVTPLIGATIVQTEPMFIVTGGNFSPEGIIGSSPNYCVIEDPENGKISLGMYSGSHVTGEIITINVNGSSHSATVLKKLPDNYRKVLNQYSNLNDQIRDLNSTIDALKSQKWEELSSKWQEQEEKREQHYDVLKDYIYANYDYSSDIICFQIGNPYYFSFSNHICMIEDDNYDASPVAINGSTLIPARPLMDSVGGETIWEASTPNLVSLSYNLKDITLTLNDPVAIVNGKPVVMPVAPQVINGKTMIPLRFVSEQFDMKVDWIQQDQIVRINCNKEVACIPQENGTQLIKDSRYNGQITYVVPGNCDVYGVGTYKMSEATAEVVTIEMLDHGEITLSEEYSTSGPEYFNLRDAGDPYSIEYTYPKGISSINAWCREDGSTGKTMNKVTYVISGDYLYNGYYQLITAFGDDEILRIADELVRSITVPALN